MLNKYFGFSQLSYLKSNGIDSLAVTQIDDYESNLLTKSSVDELWSIRVAVKWGQDFDLPSIIGVNKNKALSWIYEQHLSDERYIFMCSSYYESHICGRIHIDKITTKIEASLGDFYSFKQSIPNLSTRKDFSFSYRDEINDGTISSAERFAIVELADELRTLYHEEIESSFDILYEFDFVIGTFADKNGVKSKDKFFKVVGMRSYNLKNDDQLFSM